jgi:hypothetical protein
MQRRKVFFRASDELLQLLEEISQKYGVSISETVRTLVIYGAMALQLKKPIKKEFLEYAKKHKA